MDATVRDGHAPAVVVSLSAGEKLVSEAGAMMFLSGDVAMDVEMQGGLMGGLKRKVLAGESLFLTTYIAGGDGVVGFCGPFPGSIRQVELGGDGAAGELICEKHAYLAHVGEIAIEPVSARSLGAGLTGGGEGFFLQRLTGTGTLWIHGGGDFLDFDLAEGERLVVDTGCVVSLEPSVRYETKLRGGIKKSLFGGEGFFLVHLSGPGKVTLQTLPFSRTAERIAEAAHLGGGQGERTGPLSGIFG